MDLANLDLNKNSERVSRFPAGQVEIEFVPNDTTVRWLNYSTLTASVSLRRVLKTYLRPVPWHLAKHVMQQFA